MRAGEESSADTLCLAGAGDRPSQGICAAGRSRSRGQDVGFVASQAVTNLGRCGDDGPAVVRDLNGSDIASACGRVGRQVSTRGGGQARLALRQVIVVVLVPFTV